MLDSPAYFRNSLPTSVEPVKATHVDVHVPAERLAGGLAEAGNDVEHAGRESGLERQFGRRAARRAATARPASG